jgi:hypothetical protein
MVFIWNDTTYSGDYTISDSQITITLSTDGKIIIYYSIKNNKIILTKIITPDNISHEVNYTSDKTINDTPANNEVTEIEGL